MSSLSLSVAKTWLSRLGTRQLLAIGFGVVLAMLALITVMAQRELARSVEQVQQLASAQKHLSDLTREMAHDVGTAYQALLSAVLVSEADDVAFQRKRITSALKHYAETDAALIESMHGAPAELKTLHAEAKARAEDNRRSLEPMLDRVGDPQERDLMAGFVANTMQPGFEQWLQALQTMETQRRKAAEAETEQVKQQVDRSRHTLTLFAAIAVLFGVVSAALISRSIVQPLAAAVRLAEQVAHGDLSKPIQASHGGEVGALQTALKHMQEGLRRLVGEVQEASATITLASNEIAQGNQDLSNRIEHTSHNLQRAASAMTNLGEGVRATATAARQADGQAASSRSAVQEGSTAVSGLERNMRSVQIASAKIADITALIDSLAFQTNVLALNASVEAARAGDQGRGFAVVAGEVRALAHRSAAASKEIRSLIETNLKTVESGQQFVDTTVAAMSKISAGVGSLSAVIAEISAASVQQDKDAQQVSAEVGHIDEMTQQNAAFVEQGAAAAASLREETRRLQSLIGVFRLEDGNELADTKQDPEPSQEVDLQ